jgi:hypothetical protein
VSSRIVTSSAAPAMVCDHDVHAAGDLIRGGSPSPKRGEVEPEAREVRAEVDGVALRWPSARPSSSLHMVVYRSRPGSSGRISLISRWLSSRSAPGPFDVDLTHRRQVLHADVLAGVEVFLHR